MIVILMVLILALKTLGLGDGEPAIEAISIPAIFLGLGCVLGPLVVFGALYYWIRYLSRKQAMSTESLAKVIGWVDPHGIAQNGPAGSHYLPLSLASVTTERADFILLRHRERPHFYVLRSSAFSDRDAWTRAREYLLHGSHSAATA